MKNRVGVLLSGEGISIASAEAKALFLAYDPSSRFDMPEGRVLLAETDADPDLVSRRIAFARRVGILLEKPGDAAEAVRGKRVSFRPFSLPGSPFEPLTAAGVLRGLDARVDLERPDVEFTSVAGKSRYLLLTHPGTMRQGWSSRRPRSRAFFHPSAIFPKLARALVNLTRVKEGETLLDPFAGTGSLLLEAWIVGARAVAMDQSRKMASGSLSNMRKLGQEWLGVIRGDAFRPPMVSVDAVATDVPYGRASTTRGNAPADVVGKALDALPQVVRSGGRVVLMHPKQVSVTQREELEVEEEHDMYIHKRLTRTITVLRRR